MLNKAATILKSLFPPLPFLLAGGLPFGVGALLSGVSGLPWRPGVLAAGSLAVAALILAAFASREAFGPGEGRCPAWRLDLSRPPQNLAYGALGVAVFLGVVLQFGFRTGDFTIPLGGIGILGGYFSFAPPLKWHHRGLGEVAGGLCFGLLPVFAGLYLQCGQLLTEALLYGLPLTFTGFNLFLVYGFPAVEGSPDPYSLAARVQPAAAILIYTICNVLTIIGLVLILFFPAPDLPWRGGLWPLLALAVVNQELAKRQAYRREARILLLCRLTLALHLAMGLVFTLMLWQRL